MDFTNLFRYKGYRFKYVFTLGFLAKPQSIEQIESFHETLLTDKKLEKEKRLMMKIHNLPIIKVDVIALYNI